jgi:hypothetical protein
LLGQDEAMTRKLTPAFLLGAFFLLGMLSFALAGIASAL